MGSVDIIGLLGLILGIIFYFKSKIEKCPVFVYQDTLLQSRSYPGITIHFQNEKVESLRRLRVLFFNKGRKEIRSEDRPISGFPVIDFPDGTRILASSLLGTSCQESDFRIEETNDKFLKIGFDYLNHGDGGVVEIMYDGGDIRDQRIIFNAALIGALPARSYRFVVDEQKLSFITAFTTVMSLFLGYQAIVMLDGASAKILSGTINLDVVSRILLGLLFASFPVFGIWFVMIKSYRDAVPRWSKKYFGVD
jgi:hypothetical protein